MENKYFYVSSTSNEIYKININDFNFLAILALTLNDSSLKDAEVHINNLNNFFNIHFNHQYYLIYQLIAANQESLNFLKSIINLTILENQFRTNNIKEITDIIKYNEYSNEFQKQIALNNEDYEITSKKI